METKRQTESSIKGHDLPISLLRMLAPPLQLFSAAMWQVVQQGIVSHYGVLEEFVTTVTELVPELMSYRQRAQLILGLRARMVLDLCHGEQPADDETIQTHLDRMKAPAGSPIDHDMIAQVVETEANFVELVHTLLENTSERDTFFQEVFPMHFGSRYDTALEILLWEFISRLEELLPVPDFGQMVSWLRAAPSVLDECLQSLSPPTEMKSVLQYHQKLGLIEVKDPSALPMDDCILGALSLPPTARLGIKTAQINQKKEDNLLITINIANVEDEMRISEMTLKGSEAMEEILQSWKGGRELRKRKCSESLEVHPKQPTDAVQLMDSSEVLEHPCESPLISIWGDYTDPSEDTYSVTTDAKVPWSDEETLNLLDIWGKDSVQKVLKGCVKNRHIFTLISKKMSERGFLRTVEQCQTRIKRLKKCFRQCLQHNINNGNPRLECKFYDQLEEILGKTTLSAVSKVPFNSEDVDADQAQDTDEWEFLGHTGLDSIGTKSVPWTDLETLTLINIWGEDRMQQELRGMHRNGNIFVMISNKMSSQGFIRTAEQCQTRVKRLKASFRQCYENNIKGKEQVECKFYEPLERILVNEIPGYTTMTEKSLEMESRQGDSLDNESSIHSHQEIDPAIHTLEERKKIPWGDGETLILLELWGDEKVQMNLRRCPHNGHIYSEISGQLISHGYYRTAEQCHTRIKRLKARYRQCQESISSSGSEQMDFKFYNVFKRILGGQHSTFSTAESIEISNDSHGNTMTETEGLTTDCQSVLTDSSRKMPWSEQETRTLLEIWGQDCVQIKLRGCLKNRHVFEYISQKMIAQGFIRTAEQCHTRVKRVKAGYVHEKKEFKFYDQMEDIFSRELNDDNMDLIHETGPAVWESAYEIDINNASHVITDGSKFPWTDNETQVLLDVWGCEDMQDNLKGCTKNKHIFTQISQAMCSQGYMRTAEQCQSRVKRLKANFRQCCESKTSGKVQMECKFYNQFLQVLVNKNGTPNTLADISNSSKEEQNDLSIKVVTSLNNVY